jgi:hypothetical protein
MKITYNIVKMFSKNLLDDNERFFQFGVRVYEKAW